MILKPTDPEFKKMLAGVKGAFQQATGSEDVEAEGVNLEDSYGALEAQWTEAVYRDFLLSHTILAQTPTKSKLVFHFKKISRFKMEEISVLLHNELVNKMQPQAAIMAGISPIFRDQWDLILFHVPTFRAPILRDQILTIIEKFQG